jgi:uncharacterized RDD family membrane protein YckC
MGKAEISERLFAAIIDLILWGIVIAIMNVIVVVMSYTFQSLIWPQYVFFILNILTIGLFLPCYLIFCSASKHGMTIGKRFMSIRVVDKTTYDKITFTQALKRDWLLVAIGSIYVVQRIVFLIVAMNYDGRGLLATSSFGYWLATAIHSAPFLWFVLEVVSTAANPEKESVQDRSTSSLTVIKE